MPAIILSWTTVGVVTATSIGLLLNRDWRWDLGLLATQYLGVSILVAQHWPVGMAAAKLVTGWMATAALGMTLTALPPHEEPDEQFWPQGRVFRLFMAGMILILALAITPRIESVMAGVGAPEITGAILLSGMGLLHIGTSSRIVRVVFALLTFLAGFEILYSAVEGSILVAALLTIVSLGIVLAGAYLLNASGAEELP